MSQITIERQWGVNPWCHNKPLGKINFGGNIFLCKLHSEKLKLYSIPGEISLPSFYPAWFSSQWWKWAEKLSMRQVIWRETFFPIDFSCSFTINGKLLLLLFFSLLIHSFPHILPFFSAQQISTSLHGEEKQEKHFTLWYNTDKVLSHSIVKKDFPFFVLFQKT